MVTDERDPLMLVDEQRVGRAVTRARDDAQVAAAGADRRAVGEHDVGVIGLRPVADEVPELLGVGPDGLRHAVVAHQREREPPIGLTARLVVGAVCRGALVGRDPGPRTLGDRGREPAVVEVVVRDQDELDVLHADAGCHQTRFERGQRLVVAWAGVDQGQRVAAQQPGVDRPDVRERKRDAERGVHRD
jgi:hypothetical protein